ncbi:MAG: hypothetical protein AB1793_04165 [Candidatus Thermoplasmatota archaeon]
MPKKMDRGEPKKECPSCGLGVSLEANICEFCGWDFEEEDEWILQIEKLERELLLEKQKFEPGSVGEKIESTLRTPAMEMAEAEREAAKAQPEAAAGQRTARTAEDLIVREALPAQRQPEPVQPRPQPVVERAAPAPVQAPAPARAPAPAPAPVQRQPEPEPAPVRAAPQQQAPPDTTKIRKVRSVRPPAGQPSPAPAPQPAAAPQVAPQRPQPQAPVLQERKVRIPEPEAAKPAAQELPERKVRTVRKVKG